jgi:hypothetical protein
LQQRACLGEEVLVPLVAECHLLISAWQSKSGRRGAESCWLLSLPRTRE